MTVWLGKLDPENLSIHDIAKSKTAIWKKVRHAKAMQFMQKMKAGEKLLVYHSNERQIVGVVKITANNPDPEHPRGRLITVNFVKKFDGPLVSLEDVKKSKKFDDFRLVREPRLSIMDVPAKFLNHFKIKV